MQVIETILHFWFGTLTSDQQRPQERSEIWFKKSDATDQAIKAQFESELRQATQGPTAHWEATPRGTLALVILLDQFSRNMYRDDSRSFAQDPQALTLALKGIAAGFDAKLRPVERIFLYMPLMHSEQLAHQKHCIRLFEKLSAEAPQEIQPMAKSSLDFAHRHCEIIEKFGRFPHRNDVLGRESTEEEKIFLQQPGSRF